MGSSLSDITINKYQNMDILVNALSKESGIQVHKVSAKMRTIYFSYNDLGYIMYLFPNHIDLVFQKKSNESIFKWSLVHKRNGKYPFFTMNSLKEFLKHVKYIQNKIK